MSFSSSSAATTKCRSVDGSDSGPLRRPLPLPISELRWLRARRRPRRPVLKLHERRHSMRKVEINLGLTSLRGGVLLPRSSAIASPVTPLGLDPLFSGQFSASGSDSPVSSPAVAEEEKAIALTACG
ncbi:hypothetical protein MRB53_018570 [Persea americana]|uniref:Uncharacterized protein n=1 Tax=Persea americana TaxID=3435 RepID=A0ACC2M7U0_PERAE|nr:hypothetical protein MRB53_018570 [Persea americana]